MSDLAKTYRAAIVGLGYIGGGDQVSGDAIGGQKVADLDGTHAAALIGNKRIQVVAGSSRDGGRRERFTERTGIKTYADWRELLDQEKKLDIVSVATYAPQHAEITEACAKKRVKVIYCEKPIATRIADAERMVKICARKGSLLVINHNREFNPNYRRLRALIVEGRLGALTSVTIRWGNGRMGNVATHFIDALCLLTSQKVAAVSGTLDLSHKPDCRGPEFSDPGAFGWLRLDGGTMVSIDAADYGKGPLQFTLHGTLGEANTGGRNVSLKFWDGSSEEWAAPADGLTGMDRAVAEIVDYLDGKGPFFYDAAQAVHVFEAIVAFHASHARKSAWVELPLKGRDRKIEVKSG